MKEFLVKEHLKDKEFSRCLLNVVRAGNDKEKIIESFKKLDKFISLESGVGESPLVFAPLEEKGRFDFQDFVLVNENMSKCKNNIELIEVYLHEKRHHLQYHCYLKNIPLFGQDMLDDIKDYFERKNVCIMSKKSVFEGLYGYYGRSMEKDAYEYAYDQTIELLQHFTFFGSKEEREDYIWKYRIKQWDFNDAELAHWIDQHKKRFVIRKQVEEEMLKHIKETIKHDIGNKYLKRIICSRTLFECLDNEEKQIVANYIVGVTPKQVEKSDLVLEKLISKNVSKEMKQKRSR